MKCTEKYCQNCKFDDFQFFRRKLGADIGPADKMEGATLVPDIDKKFASEFTRRSLEKKIRLVLNEILRSQHLSNVQRPLQFF